MHFKKQPLPQYQISTSNGFLPGQKNLVIGLLLDFIKILFGFFWFSKRLKLKGF
jgi:hypothetical protein